MHPLERALKDLEIATAALAEIPLEDAVVAGALLRRRSLAIERLAGLTAAPLEAAVREDALRRLEAVSGLGLQAQQRLDKTRRQTLAEWSQWNRIYRALGAASRPDPGKVDCLG